MFNPFARDDCSVTDFHDFLTKIQAQGCPRIFYELPVAKAADNSGWDFCV